MGELRMQPAPPHARGKRFYHENGLTAIQADVLEFIMKCIHEKYPPTHREIVTHFKWNSSAAAKCHILALEKKGFIKTNTNVSRGIETTLKSRVWHKDLIEARVASPTPSQKGEG